MTYENNRRYTAESWIDNEREEEFKTSYLNALFEQKEGHGNGFDADMLDGYHASDFIERIEESTKNLLSDFKIGYTHFSNANDIITYYLGFEGIKLYNNQFEGPTEEEMLLPWERSQESIDIFEEEEPPSLSAVFYKLYDLTFFGEEGKTNNEVFTEYKETLIDIGNRVDDIESALDGKLVPDPYNSNRMLLNSDSVNGIRFFIKTQAQYTALKESASRYDPENSSTAEHKNDYDLINSVHNVFIIKSEDELRASGYEDGIYSENPDSPVMTKSYQFRIINDGTENEPHYVLQYAYVPDGVDPEDYQYWNNLADADVFVSQEKVKEELLNILEEEDSYSLNKDAVLNQFYNFTKSDLFNKGNQPTALKDIFNNYIVGGFYNDEEDQKHEIPKTIEEIQLDENVYAEGRYLNLTGLRNELKSNASSIEDRITQEINRVNTTVNTTNSSLATLERDVERIKGAAENDVSLESLQTSLKNLSTQLGNLSTQLTQIQNDHEWIKYNETNPNDNFVKKTKGRIWYTKNRNLCHIRFIVTIKKANEWVTVTPALPKFLQPIWNTYFVTNKLDTIAKVIDDDSTTLPNDRGKFQVYTKQSVPLDVQISGFYLYGNKQS